MTSHLPTPGTLIAGHLDGHPPVPFFTVRVAVAASRHVGARPYVKPGVGASAFLFTVRAANLPGRSGARPGLRAHTSRGACFLLKKFADLHEGPHPIAAVCRPGRDGISSFVSSDFHAATLGVERNKDVREVYGEIRNE